jgi:hypothetical protein
MRFGVIENSFSDTVIVFVTPEPAAADEGFFE